MLAAEKQPCYGLLALIIAEIKVGQAESFGADLEQTVQTLLIRQHILTQFCALFSYL